MLCLCRLGNAQRAWPANPELCHAAYKGCPRQGGWPGRIGARTWLTRSQVSYAWSVMSFASAWVARYWQHCCPSTLPKARTLLKQACSRTSNLNLAVGVGALVPPGNLGLPINGAPAFREKILEACQGYVQHSDWAMQGRRQEHVAAARAEARNGIRNQIRL